MQCLELDEYKHLGKNVASHEWVAAKLNLDVGHVEDLLGYLLSTGAITENDGKFAPTDNALDTTGTFQENKYRYRSINRSDQKGKIN